MQLGNYNIEAEIGEGAFAIVYRAVEQVSGQVVALKILRPELLADRRFVQMFQAEGQTIKDLIHPNIVPVFFTGLISGRLCQAMAYAEGGSLSHQLHLRGPLPWQEAIQLLRSVAAALDYAHSKGVIHRDLKPANILIDERNKALLSDFGLAAIVSESSVSRSLGKSITGTYQYLAPELWDDGKASPQSDIYAFACVAGEILGGEPLFPGDTIAKIYKAHHEGPHFPKAWPTGVPQGITSVLRQALAKDPQLRPTSATELVAALNSAGRSQKPSSFRRNPLIWLVALLIMLIGGSSAAWANGWIPASFLSGSASLLTTSAVPALVMDPTEPVPSITPTATPSPQRTATAQALAMQTSTAAARTSQAVSRVQTQAAATESGLATVTAAVAATTQAETSVAEQGTATAQAQQMTAQAGKTATAQAQSRQVTAQAAAATIQAQNQQATAQAATQATAAAQSQQATTQAEQSPDIFNFRVVSETNTRLVFQVDYRYNGDPGDIAIFPAPPGGASWNLSEGAVSPGTGTVELSLELVEASISQGSSVTTESILLVMTRYPTNNGQRQFPGQGFLTKSITYHKVWSRQ